MTDETEGRALALSRVLACLAAAVGCVVLCGYAFGAPLLIRLSPGMQGMSPLTATSLIALAVGIVAASTNGTKLARSAVTATIVMVGAVLVGYAFQGDDVASARIARALFNTPVELVGRMSTATVLGLLLIATGLATRKRVGLPDWTAGAALLIATTALLGYAYAIQVLYALSAFSTMALHTAIALLLLSFATMLVEPHHGWSATLLSSHFGGRTTRRQLALLLVPVVVGWILREGTLHNRLDAGSALLLLVIITAAPVALMVLRDGRAQIALDRERRSHAAAQAALARELASELALKAEQLERESSERSRVEAAMYRTQRVEAIGQLTGGIAHDFNNLLAAIGGNLELLLRKLPTEHGARRHAAAAANAVGKGAKLANQLLAFSRSQRLAIQPTEITPILKRTRELIGNALGPSIELLLEYPHDTLWASTDPDQLELAVFNLAVNARDAMPDGGLVRIESGVRTTTLSTGAAPRPYVAIRVSDTGTGMTPEVLSKAVEPFFTTRERGKGSGLGLAQVYGFVRQCEGDLVIESTPGQGTTVEILLPQTTAPSQPAAASLPTEPVADEAMRKRLLVIDDDDTVRQVLVELLSDAHYDVTEAAGGAEGLALLDQCAPDAAVIDFLMPGMNGAEVARHAQARMPGLPIVFVSGYADTLALEGIAGAQVLRKPFQGEQLQAAVASALAGHAT